MTAIWQPSSDLERLRLELEFAELEAGGFAYGLAAPAADPVARRRDRLPHEAHVDFDAIEADLDAVTARAAATALRLRPDVLEVLLTRLDDAHTPPLATLNDLQVVGLAGLPGVPDQLAGATDAIHRDLLELAARSSIRVQGELVASGMPPDAVRHSAPSSGTAAALADAAARVTTQTVAQLIGAATTVAAHLGGPGTPPTDVQRGITDAVADLSDRGITDLAGQSANRAAGLGRGDGVDGLDPDALEVRGRGGHAEIYASELIDKATCYPCALVDGNDYPTAAAAAEDYPFGQYAACLGGGRCRGMLVYVWAPEAPATIGLPR